MNEIQLILLGLLVLATSAVFFYLTDVIPSQIRSTEMEIIVSLGVGLLILVVDKRQDHYLDEIMQTQHKLTQEIHNMIKEQMRLINKMGRDSSEG
jgi:hypothetical protein